MLYIFLLTPFCQFCFVLRPRGCVYVVAIVYGCCISFIALMLRSLGRRGGGGSSELANRLPCSEVMKRVAYTDQCESHAAVIHPQNVHLYMFFTHSCRMAVTITHKFSKKLIK